MCVRLCVPDGGLPDPTTAGVVVQRTDAVLPGYVIGTVRRPVDNALQLNGTADAVEFLGRRDPSVIVDCDERNCKRGKKRQNAGKWGLATFIYIYIESGLYLIQQFMEFSMRTVRYGRSCAAIDYTGRPKR